MARSKSSPWRYDRAAIRYVLEREGLEVARSRWPRGVVDPIARVLGLTAPYKAKAMALSVDQVAVLGTKPDSVLAGEWCVPPITVGVARRLLGIPSHTKRWRQEKLRLTLSNLTDSELCQPLDVLMERTGLQLHVLIAERHRRNIRGSARGASVRVGLLVRRRTALRALRAAYPGITLSELAEVFGLTRERVRQLEQAEEIETVTQRSA